MRKTFFFIIFLILIGCKSTSIGNTKLDNKTEKMLKGNWIISAVNYPGSDYFKVNSFNLGDSKCFIGSNWSFISNNNKGEMSLNSPVADCKSFNSPITWYVNKEGNFVFKITNTHKAKNVGTGFVLTINNQTATSFDLIDKIKVASETKQITYSFQRK